MKRRERPDGNGKGKASAVVAAVTHPHTWYAREASVSLIGRPVGTAAGRRYFP